MAARRRGRDRRAPRGTATDFDRRAARARRLGNEVASRYWAARAEGQRDRFARVRACAKSLGTIRATCRGCGVVHELPARCDHAWFCVACRGELKKAQRKRFGLARAGKLAAALKRGLFRRDRPGGRFGEKFMTFTVPHRGWDDRTGRYFVLSAEERVRLRDEAFPKLIREVRRYWRVQSGDAADFVAWQRRYEWTPGADGLGHPHVHVWALCPYIPRAMLKEWWYRALANVGWCGGRAMLVPDIREPHGKDLERELIKYLVKDLVGDGDFVAPETYATAYRLHDGKRRTQSSRGFMSRIPLSAPCGACREHAGHDVEFDRNLTDSFSTRRPRGNVVPLKRGPPWEGTQRFHAKP